MAHVIQGNVPNNRHCFWCLGVREEFFVRLSVGRHHTAFDISYTCSSSFTVIQLRGREMKASNFSCHKSSEYFTPFYSLKYIVIVFAQFCQKRNNGCEFVPPSTRSYLLSFSAYQCFASINVASFIYIYLYEHNELVI